MKNRNSVIHASIASVLALGIATSMSSAAAADDKEKCYGVSTAGKNDCAGAAGTHSCAGQSKVDKDPNTWKFVASGTCEKMGGKLTAVSTGKKVVKKDSKT